MVDLDRPFHRLDIVELHHRLDLQLVLAKNLIDRLAGRDVRVKADELLTREILHLDLGALRNRVIRVGDHDQVVLAKRQYLDLPLLHRKRHEPKIHRVVQNILIHEVGAPVFHPHIDRGKIVEKFLNKRRQLVQPNRVNSGQTDRTANHFFHLLQLREQLLKGVQHLLRRIVNPLTLTRELKLLLTPVDQQRFEMPLHRPRLLAHRRLRNAVELRRFRKTLRLNQVREDFEVFNLHD